MQPPTRSPEPIWSFVRSRFLKTLRSAVWFFFDTILAAVIYGCISAFSLLFPALCGPGGRLLLDWFPLRYLFDFGHGAVVILYVWALVRQALAGASVFASA
jgi:hypothetical protein